MKENTTIQIGITDIKNAVSSMGRVTDEQLAQDLPTTSLRFMKDRLSTEEHGHVDPGTYDFSNWTTGGLRGGRE